MAVATRWKSFGQVETPGLSMDCRYKNFYTTGNMLSSNLLFTKEGERKIGVVPSYELLIQTPLAFGAVFNALPKPKEMPLMAILHLVNGEFGLRYGAFDAGITNAFHLYFTRRVHHQTGLVLRYGEKHRLSISAIEQDRMNSSPPEWGIGIGYQFVGPPQ